MHPSGCVAPAGWCSLGRGWAGPVLVPLRAVPFAALSVLVQLELADVAQVERTRQTFAFLSSAFVSGAISWAVAAVLSSFLRDEDSTSGGRCE